MYVIVLMTLILISRRVPEEQEAVGKQRQARGRQM